LSVDLHQSAFIKALSGPARAEIAEYLVRLGIDSISLLPDTVLRTALAIIEIKKKLGRSPAPGRPEPRHRLHHRAGPPSSAQVRRNAPAVATDPSRRV